MLKERIGLILAHRTLKILLHLTVDFLRGRLDDGAVCRDGFVCFGCGGFSLGDVFFCFESGDAAGACGRVSLIPSFLSKMGRGTYLRW